jgi:hypothetical protein
MAIFDEKFAKLLTCFLQNARKLVNFLQQISPRWEETKKELLFDE